LPSIVRKNALSQNTVTGEVLTGDEATEESLEFPDTVVLYDPMVRGYVTNTTSQKAIWEADIEERGMDPVTCPTVITYSPLTLEATENKLAEMMFELGMPEVTLVNTAEMTLLFAGLQTGLVIESGFQATFAVPVVDGVAQDAQTVGMQLGSFDVIMYLNTLLMEQNGLVLTSTAESMQLDDLRAEICWVAKNYILASYEAQPFTLESGEVIYVREAQYQAPELLFQPELNGIDSIGLVEAVYEAVINSPEEFQEELWANIVLGGGNTLYPGLKERLEYDLSLYSGHTVNVIALNNREFSAWIGAKEVGKIVYADHSM